MEGYVKAVAVVLLISAFLIPSNVVQARSIQAGDDYESDLFESRQLLTNLLPSWFNRLRNRLPEALTGRKTIDHPIARKPAEVLNWPSVELDVGQITGVAVDENGNPVLFHRGNVKWDGGSFDGARHYNHIGKGPIVNDTIVTLDRTTGVLVDHWGSNLFYMPHGLEVDSEGNVWVTDVALHQVLKFPKGSRTPSLTLGEAFVTGSDDSHFCQPTDVAVASNGVFFVADGYCNKRIMKFSPEGKLLATHTGKFNVPHSLALFEDRDSLCIADRDNARLVCIHAGLSESSKFGAPFGRSSGNSYTILKPYAVANKDNDVYAVFGSVFLGQATGKTIHLDNLETESSWSPAKGFGTPHDVVISKDGESMYVVEIGPNRITKFALE